MDEHERGFLAFLTEQKRRRVGALLESGPKRRGDLRALLDHAIDFDPRRAKRIAGAEAFPGAIEAMLVARGAPAACHILSACRDLDGQTLPLREALDAVVGKGHGSFLSCIAGRLGFFEGEGPGESWLLLAAA